MTYKSIPTNIILGNTISPSNKPPVKIEIGIPCICKPKITSLIHVHHSYTTCFAQKIEVLGISHSQTRDHNKITIYIGELDLPIQITSNDRIEK